MSTQHVTLAIGGLSCGGGGALTVERALERLPGVKRAYVNPAMEMAYVEFDPDRIDPTTLSAAVDRVGFHAENVALFYQRRQWSRRLSTDSGWLQDALNTEVQTARTKARYDRQATSYDRRTALMERLVFQSLRRQIWSQVSGPDVLEVGVGTGANLPYYPEGVRVTAIDLSDQMLARARQRVDDGGVAVRLLEMDAQNLQFPQATFDSAASTCVFCSVPDPVRGLREVYRVLKPGGRLLMVEHVRGTGLLGPLFDLLNPLVVRVSGANINRRTLENVRQADFAIESVESRFTGIVKVIVARKRPLVPDDIERQPALPSEVA